MAFAYDANGNPTMVREGDPIGGYLTPETPSPGVGGSVAWYRLMPQGNTASVDQDNPRQLNIGGLRSDIEAVDGWNLVILNTGYYEHHKIVSHDGNAVQLDQAMQHHRHHKDTPIAIAWVMFPSIDVPLSITYFADPSAADNKLMIGVAKTEVYAPTPKEYIKVANGQMLIMNTQQLHKIFYSNAGHANDRISWGEHYIA